MSKLAFPPRISGRSVWVFFLFSKVQLVDDQAELEWKGAETFS
jgi:hypothetical protein